jgi:integrase
MSWRGRTEGQLMAFVEKRVRGKTVHWRARYRGPDGRERSQSFTRRTDAEQFLVQVEADKARGTWIDPVRGEVAMGEWAERWLSSTVHLKPKTRLGYESLLRSRILPSFAKAPIAAIRPLDVREWLARMQADGLSASRCRQAYHLLGSILDTAVQDGRIATSPCVGIKLPRLTQTEMAYLRPEQVRDVLAVVDHNYRLLLEVLAIAGLRFGEAAALRRSRCDILRSRLIIAENLSEVSGVLHYVAPKTHQRRVVTIPRFLGDRLARNLQGLPADDSLVFTSPRGESIRYSNFAARVWKPALREAGLPDMGVHALRHTCAALLISQGAHPKAIQRHLGHQSITTTLDRYGHLFEDEDDKLAERLDGAYARLLREPPVVRARAAVSPIAS